MEFKEINRNSLEHLYSVMNNDFESDELKPLKMIEKYIEQGICKFYGLYEQDELYCYADMIFSERAALIDYFAVTEKFRGKGVGSTALKLLAENLKKQNFIIAEVESTEQASNEAELITIERRLDFYKRNGLYLSGNRVCLFGHKYEIMVLPINSKPDKDETLEKLFEIYRLMFSKEIIDRHISLI